MGLSVLIVGDSAVMRKILERSLRQAQVQIEQVLEARNGAEALERLKAEAGIQVVFSDVDMPNMDGLEFLRQLRQLDQFRKIPVVMVTTEGSEATVMEARSLGASGYIKKPFTPLQMQEALQKVLSQDQAASGRGRAGV